MKTIENKTTEILGQDEKEMTFADLAKFCINNIPQGGFDVSTMRARLKVVDKLDNANGVIELEDAEHETLKSAVNSMKWATMHKDIIDFTDSL